jgi:hypothetical protein
MKEIISKIIELLFSSTKPISVNPVAKKEVEVQPKKTAGDIVAEKDNFKSLTVNDVITSSGRYPERAKSLHLTEEVRKNIEELLKRVNPLLKELKIDKPSVSSGFRPPEVNAAVANAGKRSAHMTGEAVDIFMPLGKEFDVDEKLLEKYNLYQEKSAYTRGKVSSWLHFQTRKASKRLFIP